MLYKAQKVAGLFSSDDSFIMINNVLSAMVYPF